MNDSYFPHDSNSRNSDKLIPVRMKFGAEGYGIYFMILERLREEKNYMSIKDYNTLAFDLRVDTSKLKAVVEDFGLFTFTENGECFYSEGFNARMEIKDAKSKKRSEAGKKGATKRWQKDSEAIATSKEDNSKNDFANAIAKKKNSKERKEKETKGNKSKVNNKKQAKDLVVESPSNQQFIEQPFGSDKLGELIAYYSKNVSPATPVNITDLEYDLNDFNGDLELMKDAINICARENKRTYKYFAGILKNWRADGVKTHDEYLDKERRWEEEKQAPPKQPFYRQPVRQETMPDWVDNPTPEATLPPEEKAKLDAEIQAFLSKGGEIR